MNAEVKALWDDNETWAICHSGPPASGKTFDALNMLLYDAFRYPGTRYFFVYPQSQELLIQASIQEVIEGHRGFPAAYSSRTNEILFPASNGSKINLYPISRGGSRHYVQTIAGQEFTKGVFDAANNIPMNIIETFTSRVGRFANDHYEIKGKVLINCRPEMSGHMRDIFWYGHQHGVLQDGVKMVVAANTNMTDEQRARVAASLPDPESNMLMFGLWESPTLAPDLSAFAGFPLETRSPPRMYL
jgi:hypothetical protein